MLADCQHEICCRCSPSPIPPYSSFHYSQWISTTIPILSQSLCMSNFDTVWLTLHHTLTSQKNQHRLCLWGRNYYGLACPLSRCASQHFATQVRATLRPPKNANKGVHYLVYVNWDYEEYCAECRGVKVARGDNSAKEGKLREKWGPKTRGTMRIDTPRTVVDRKGIIMTWILPEVIPQKYQVRCVSYM